LKNEHLVRRKKDGRGAYLKGRKRDSLGSFTIGESLWVLPEGNNLLRNRVTMVGKKARGGFRLSRSRKGTVENIQIHWEKNGHVKIARKRGGAISASPPEILRRRAFLCL